jgi:hypothetical protein
MWLLHHVQVLILGHDLPFAVHVYCLDTHNHLNGTSGHFETLIVIVRDKCTDAKIPIAHLTGRFRHYTS